MALPLGKQIILFRTDRGTVFVKSTRTIERPRLHLRRLTKRVLFFINGETRACTTDGI